MTKSNLDHPRMMVVLLIAETSIFDTNSTSKFKRKTKAIMFMFMFMFMYKGSACTRLVLPKGPVELVTCILVEWERRLIFNIFNIFNI